MIVVSYGLDPSNVPPGAVYDPVADTWAPLAVPMEQGETFSPLVAAWTGCAAVFWGTVAGSPVGWLYEPPATPPSP